MFMRKNLSLPVIFTIKVFFFSWIVGLFTWNAKNVYWLRLIAVIIRQNVYRKKIMKWLTGVLAIVIDFFFFFLGDVGIIDLYFNIKTCVIGSNFYTVYNLDLDKLNLWDPCTLYNVLIYLFIIIIILDKVKGLFFLFFFYLNVLRGMSLCLGFH